MIYRANLRTTLFLAILASTSVACGFNPATRSATAEDTTTATHVSTPTTGTLPQPARGASSSPTNKTPPTIPADLHFTPADIKYLQSADPDARALAIQRRHDNQAALAQVSKLNNGYTDSLKKWSISTAKKAR